MNAPATSATPSNPFREAVRFFSDLWDEAFEIRRLMALDQVRRQLPEADPSFEDVYWTEISFRLNMKVPEETYRARREELCSRWTNSADDFAKLLIAVMDAARRMNENKDKIHSLFEKLSELTNQLVQTPLPNYPSQSDPMMVKHVLEQWDNTHFRLSARYQEIVKSLKLLAGQWDCMASQLQVGDARKAGEPEAPDPAPKRSTERGEGRVKLIAALTQHHQYADGGCLNFLPIGSNELARKAAVSASTASAFFNDKFQGHTKYKALCWDADKLKAALKLLNDEFAPYHLLGAASSDLAAPEPDDADSES